MITSLFSLIKPDIGKDYQIKNLKEHLFNIGATKKFEGIYADYGANAERVIAYLIFTYSFDSTLIIGGDDWLSTKKGIMELVKLDTEEFADVLNLKKESVKTAVLWLSKEVKDWRHEQLLTWKESCQILDQIATTKPDEKNKSGAKNIGDANKFSYETKRKIEALEKEILQTSKSQERLKEVGDLNLANISMERLLKEITQK